MPYDSVSSLESSDSPEISTASIKTEATAVRAQFRAHVIPDLRAGVRRLTPFLRNGSISFSEAVGTIMQIAVRRGAHLMAPEDLGDLHHWVMDTIVHYAGEDRR